MTTNGEFRQDPSAHWDEVYRNKAVEDVSWFEEVPVQSLSMIKECGLTPGDAIVDVGGGASRLVDHLLQEGYRDLTVTDIARPALEAARARLGDAGQRVRWIPGDITRTELAGRYRLWHDRAVFHFLTEADVRERYLAVLHAALLPGGHLVIATFAPDGPERCSGLPVQRYDAMALASVLGPGFSLAATVVRSHVTPQGRAQSFTYCRFTRLAA
ncbi:MAG: class I SAM-dependent methyltransferase [Acidiferrobacteraceae bacterium]